MEKLNFFSSRKTFARMDKFYPFLCLSFPDLSYRQYQKINYGRHFEGWLWAENETGEMVACTAIFKRSVGYKMGLFCTHPQMRRKGIGKAFYAHVSSVYTPLEWTAITPESIRFYTDIGAVDHGRIRGMDGAMYTLFKTSV
jgi:GNAT superfamily N-acetyltransferase